VIKINGARVITGTEKHIVSMINQLTSPFIIARWNIISARILAMLDSLFLT